MPSGIIGAATLLAAIEQDIFVGPQGTLTSCTVSLANAGQAPAVVVLKAVAPGITAAAGQIIEPRVSLQPGQVFERGGLVIAAGQKLVAAASAAGVDAVVWGVE